jgi:hypothetical protein
MHLCCSFHLPVDSEVSIRINNCEEALFSSYKELKFVKAKG